MTAPETTAQAELSPLARRLLDRIQVDFPLVEDPYACLAVELDVSRDEIFGTIRELRRTGVIRRIGGSFAAPGVGYISALVAARVEPARIEEAAAAAAAFPEVTHDYERDDEYNLWFTVIAENRARMDTILAAVRERPGVHAVYELPAIRTFKIRVDFDFHSGERR